MHVSLWNEIVKILIYDLEKKKIIINGTWQKRQNFEISREFKGEPPGKNYAWIYIINLSENKFPSQKYYFPINLLLSISSVSHVSSYTHNFDISYPHKHPQNDCGNWLLLPLTTSWHIVHRIVQLIYLTKKKTSVKRNQRCRRNLLRPSYKINMNQSEDEATVAYNMRRAIESRGIIPAHFRWVSYICVNNSTAIGSSMHGDYDAHTTLVC